MPSRVPEQRRDEAQGGLSLGVIARVTLIPHVLAHMALLLGGILHHSHDNRNSRTRI